MCGVGGGRVEKCVRHVREKGVREGIKTIVFESLLVKEGGRKCVHCILSQLNELVDSSFF